MTDAGISSVRDWFSWAQVEHSRGEFDWGSTDDMVAANARGGMTTLPFLFGTPAWAAGDDGQACFGGDCASYAPRTAGDADGVRRLRCGGGAPLRAGRRLLGPASRAPVPADRDLADLERAQPELVLPAGGGPLRLRAPGAAGAAGIRSEDPDAQVLLAGSREPDQPQAHEHARRS